MDEPARARETGHDGDEAAWHAVDGVVALERLASDSARGLSDEAAAQRLERYGPNQLPQAEGRSALQRFLAQFNDVLIYVLLGAAVITLLLQEWIDAGVIFGVVLINAVIGSLQEGKAEQALDAIRTMLSPEANVLRGGERRTVAARDIVPGDIVFVHSGDRVPADLRLLRQKGLQIEEAALTGESVPVNKSHAAVAADAALGDRAGMAYSGTLVTHGQGHGVVVATGVQSEIGRISTMLAEVERLTTPLIRQLSQFSKRLTGVILVVAAVTFAFGTLIRDYAVLEMFLAAVGIAVAAIPEGLPAIMTITLAIGVERMARRRAIIRRLPAVETLGSVTVICSDKTGTLTRNEMMVASLALAQRTLHLTGQGYAPIGELTENDREIDADAIPGLLDLVRGGLLCNDSRLRKTDNVWRVEGDPTEGALLACAAKLGLDRAETQRAYPRLDVIPFESEHRFMATLHGGDQGRLVVVKGAPEQVLSMCAQQHDAAEGTTPLDEAVWQGHILSMTGAGQRVIALASKPFARDDADLTFDDVDQLTLIGLFGLVDPLRNDAADAVLTCFDAGIRVKMITGDHADTARAIGRQLGLAAEDALTGRDLDALDDAALRERAQAVDVFARTSPAHKLRLVQALQASDETVAMTGDGVNDAPALKRADVGIAMGQKGTEAAKEAAEMVLADDNFASIAHAVEEGRTVYDNLTKSIAFILPTSAAEALIIITAILLGQDLPITPAQILWINMVTTVTLALALAFEPAEDGVMARPPRDPNAPLLSRFQLRRIGLVALIMLIGVFGLFVWQVQRSGDLDQARTLAVNTIVLFEALYLLNTRYLHQSVLNRHGLFGSRIVLGAIVAVLILQVLFTYLPVFNTLFDSRPLDGLSWALAGLVALSVFVAVEAEKRLTGVAHGR